MYVSLENLRQGHSALPSMVRQLLFLFLAYKALVYAVLNTR
jgi:hypothetical protein